MNKRLNIDYERTSPRSAEFLISGNALTSAVPVAQVGEPPDVPGPDYGPHHGKDKLRLVPPVAPLLQFFVGPSLWFVRHRYRAYRVVGPVLLHPLDCANLSLGGISINVGKIVLDSQKFVCLFVFPSPNVCLYLSLYTETE